VTLLISLQCIRDIQSLHLPLRRLRIGTYVQRDPSEGEPQPGQNPYHPIATATMDTTVFDVVHMFSERGISAVPIIDENGVVVNLYETVDVIVSILLGLVPHISNRKFV
jgi:CBS-domain-containing membrane protein